MSKLLLGAVALLSAYAAGRWAAPEKVVTKTEVVEVEKKDTHSDADSGKTKDTETHVIKYPDGREETIITTHEEWEKHHHSGSSSESASHATDEKEVTGSRSRVTVSALGGVNADSLFSPPIWGAAVSKPILGPVTVGIWGLSNRTLGASLGLTF